jgi:uncharacterized damage-inducible protein DinB
VSSIGDADRTEPPETGGERETLAGFLRWHRETTAWKCSGLSEADLRRAPLPTTTLTLLGLVRHLAEVEHGWVRQRVEGLDVPDLWCGDEHPDADFDDVATADVAEAFDRWRDACAHTDEVLAARELSTTFDHRGRPLSTRWLLTHLIEEYARHNGHADLIREAIDGSTGE